MADSTSERRGWLRFSMRESLLLITTLCALLALYASQRRSIPTRFLSQLDEQADLAATCRDEGLVFNAPSSGVGAGTMSRTQANRRSRFNVTSPSPSEFQRRVMPKFRDKIAALIEQSGGAITSRGLGGDDNFAVLHDFTLGYQFGSTRGIFRAYSVEGTDDRTKLLIFVDEF
ncbi:MAG: hypothetical protein AAFV43_15355 [Planctomycetota bacterium]